ncbi:MAG: type I CRISPR-associated protein Cas7 [Methylacidiphilaceae bacterium]|nr:type I CRISPR-associated protein Cas7 [Candidatus Methylacidiphilaceae bacterium]
MASFDQGYCKALSYKPIAILFMIEWIVSSFLAKQTDFDEDDLELLWQSLAQMFEHDRSAVRGEMSTRGQYVFKHDSEVGNAPARILFDRIAVARKAGTEVPRSFADYAVTIQQTDLPAGVTLLDKS